VQLEPKVSLQDCHLRLADRVVPEGLEVGIELLDVFIDCCFEVLAYWLDPVLRSYHNVDVRHEEKLLHG
jgi:hypothetical protein